MSLDFVKKTSFKRNTHFFVPQKHAANKIEFLQHNNVEKYGVEAEAVNQSIKTGGNDHAQIREIQHQHMLKLISKGFYRELMNYGVSNQDIITVSTHLLDHLIPGSATIEKDIEYYNRFLTQKNIKDEWLSSRRLIIDYVSLSPLRSELYSTVAAWLDNSAIKYSFITQFPDKENTLREYFEHRTRSYFTIYYEDKPVGLIGADHVDENSRKVEMRKFIADKDMQGMGIGKLATFLFLYYVFVHLKFNKVYIYSGNTNIRNINLNSKFGFELEGVLIEETSYGDRMRDVVRMGLLRSRWEEIFPPS